MPSQRHIIAITLQNESGALTRVAGLFSTRGYNIESLNVAATDDPTVSRLTLVTTGNDAVIHQITQPSLKLVDVVDVASPCPPGGRRATSRRLPRRPITRARARHPAPGPQAVERPH